MYASVWNTLVLKLGIPCHFMLVGNQYLKMLHKISSIQIKLNSTMLHFTSSVQIQNRRTKLGIQLINPFFDSQVLFRLFFLASAAFPSFACEITECLNGITKIVLVTYMGKILHESSPWLGEEQLESCLAGKHLEVLVDGWLNTSQQQTQVSKKANASWPPSEMVWPVGQGK